VNAVDLGQLVLRLTLFVIMGFHGTQKLFGWFDGGGLDRAEKFFASQGFRPPRFMAFFAGFTELTAAVLLGAGLITTGAVAAMTGALINIAALHIRNGLDTRKHGFEFELMMFAGVVAIGLGGPGAWSLDAVLGLPTIPWVNALAIASSLVVGTIVSATRARPATGPGIEAPIS
jgi:putative oxidoreductase